MNENEKEKFTGLNARASSEPITLKEALDECAKLLADAKALLYTPHWCGFAQFDADGKLIVTDGQTVSDPNKFLKPVFEARVFNPQVELRWLHESDGKGPAVLLTDDLDGEAVVWPESFISDHSQDIYDTIEQMYLLWGEGVEVPAKDELTPGWSRLTTARIGRLHAPLKNVTNGRVELVAREYLAEVDDHGNIAVVEERLIQLQPVPQAQNAQQNQEAAQ